MCFDGYADVCRRLEHDDPALTILNLNNKGMGNDGAIALAKAMVSNTHLVVLFLENNLLGSSAVRALSDSLRNHPRIAHLYLSHNRLGDAGCESLAELLSTSLSLQVVKVDNNEIGPNGAQYLARSFHCFVSNNSGHDVVNSKRSYSCSNDHALINIKKTHNSVQYLSLQNNNIGDDGILAFGRSLQGNTTLRSLDLRGNKACHKEKIMEEWIGLLRHHNKTLRALHLWEASEEDLLLSSTSSRQLWQQLSFWLQWNRSGRRSLESTTDRVPATYLLANAASSSADVILATLRARPDLVDRHLFHANDQLGDRCTFVPNEA